MRWCGSCRRSTSPAPSSTPRWASSPRRSRTREHPPDNRFPKRGTSMPFEQCRPEDLEFQPDYGVLATRLTRLATEPYEGGAWVVVEPGTTMTEHVNPDHETEIFFVVEGAGVMRVGAETYQVGPG